MEDDEEDHSRGLSALGLKTPVEGPQLGGWVTTLSALCIVSIALE